MGKEILKERKLLAGVTLIGALVGAYTGNIAYSNFQNMEKQIPYFQAKEILSSYNSIQENDVEPIFSKITSKKILEKSRELIREAGKGDDGTMAIKLENRINQDLLSLDDMDQNQLNLHIKNYETQLSNHTDDLNFKSIMTLLLGTFSVYSLLTSTCSFYSLGSDILKQGDKTGKKNTI